LDRTWQLQPEHTERNLQITAASLTVAADNGTRIYGAANPKFTDAVIDALNGDTFSESFSTSATATSPVMSYTIVPAVTGAAAANYNPILKNGTLTVTPAGLTVAANDAVRTYGAANPQFTGTVTGALNGESFIETFTTAATQTSPVAAYSIVPAASGPSISNYTPAIKNGMLTILPASLAVKANDATRNYGVANPSFTGAVTGAANGDSFTESFTTTATMASAPGKYPIVPSAQGGGFANYLSAATNGTLPVTAAPLTASVENATRLYGSANPTFTGSVTGAANMRFSPKSS
jgi:hypothetical protein